MKWDKQKKPSESRIRVRRRRVDAWVPRLLEDQPRWTARRLGKRIFWRNALSASVSFSFIWDGLLPAAFLLVYGFSAVGALRADQGDEFPRTLFIALTALLVIFATRSLDKWQIRHDNRLAEQQGYPYLTITKDNTVTCHMVNNRHMFEGFLVFDQGGYDYVYYITVEPDEPRTYRVNLNYDQLVFDAPQRQETWEDSIRQRQIGVLYTDERTTRRIVSLHGSKDGISSKKSDFGVFDGRVFLD